MEAALHHSPFASIRHARPTGLRPLEWAGLACLTVLAIISLFRPSVILFLLCIAVAAAATPAHDVQLRLLSPLASYSPKGTAFLARVLGPVDDNGSATLPPGTLIRGTVQKSSSVGLGLRRERAYLALQFHACELPAGEPFACDVKLLAVDNAREVVLKGNRIRGILAASHPHSWLSGLWFKPAAALFHRPASGLSGAGGMVYTHLVPNPIGAAAVLASRLILFRMPDSDIELPAGTDLVARISVPGGLASFKASPQEDETWTADLLEWLRSAPHEIIRPDRGPSGDIINFAFLGSFTELTKAFQSAGWFTADPLNAKTFARTYQAFAAMRSYSKAPVCTLHYQDRPPDIVFQKSFNSLSKRHHIRLWMYEFQGATVWLGAATHDTAITFEWSRMNFTHRIDPQIDRERTKILNDLDDAGCLDGYSAVDREGLARVPADGGEIVTDGALALARLRSCHAAASAPSLTKPRKNLFVTSLSRIILETRHYVTRGNAYYWAYRTARWGFSSRRPKLDDLAMPEESETTSRETALLQPAASPQPVASPVLGFAATGAQSPWVRSSIAKPLTSCFSPFPAP